MKKKLLPIIIAVVGIGIIVLGFVLLRKPTTSQEEVVVEEIELAEADSSIVADVTWSKTKDNTIVLSVSGLQGGYTKVAYEISYETQGVVQGVTTRPLDILEKDSFTRDDIYLGTCSRNVCRPHTGVKKISLVLEFTDTTGKKSQLTKDFDL
jgi:hypothetical protein